MNENILRKPRRRSAADDRAAIAEMLEEMQHLNEQIRNDQAQIDRLNAETAVLKAETRALLTRMGAVV